MKVTVGTSASTLDVLLGATKLTAIEAKRVKNGPGNYGVILYNDSGESVYAECAGIAATASDALPLPADTQVSFICTDLRDISLIAGAEAGLKVFIV